MRCDAMQGAEDGEAAGPSSSWFVTKQQVSELAKNPPSSSNPQGRLDGFLAIQSGKRVQLRYRELLCLKDAKAIPGRTRIYPHPLTPLIRILCQQIYIK